eukprot:SAG22_NODE_440_length_10484_cov_19.751661_10_plen_161_part_00
MTAYTGGHKKYPFHCKYIGLAAAPSFDAPMERVSPAGPLWPEQCEDPSHIWQDTRGNFHMLVHFFAREDNDAGTNPGGHAFSRDGVRWTFAGQAYTMNVTMEGGAVVAMKRRERPFVLLVDGVPAFLFTAVSPTNKTVNRGFSYTLAQGIATTRAGQGPD